MPIKRPADDPYDELMRKIFPDNFNGEGAPKPCAPESDRDSSGQPAGVNLDTYWAEKPSSFSP